MNTTYCDCCGAAHSWSWEEAFDKFGFGDGDGLVMTSVVVDTLEAAGYVVHSDKWGLHNVVINSIKQDGRELIPEDATVGYDDPRDYLPTDIIDLLDKELADDAEVQP